MGDLVVMKTFVVTLYGVSAWKKKKKKKKMSTMTLDKKGCQS